MTHYKRLRFEIPVVTPSLNDRHFAHWKAKSRWKKDATLLVRSALRRCYDERPCLARVEGRVTVSLYRYGWNVIKDKDNLYGGVKGLVDVLKDELLFEDDDQEHIRLLVDQGVNRSYQHTVIVLEWMEVAEDQIPIQADTPTAPSTARLQLSLYASKPFVEDVREQARRLEVSVSSLLKRAWRIARPEIGEST